MYYYELMMSFLFKIKKVLPRSLHCNVIKTIINPIEMSTANLQIMASKYHFLGKIVDLRLKQKM